MKKMNPLTKRILLTCFYSILFSVLIYAFFVPFVLNMPYDEMFGFWKKMFMVLAIVGPFAVIIIYSYYKPIEKAIENIDLGLKVDPENYHKATSALSKIPVFLFFVGAISYFLGVMINFLPPILKGEGINIELFIARSICAISWGIVTGVLTGRTLNISLIHAKAKMNIYHLEHLEKKQLTTTRRSLFVPILLLVIFNFSFTSISFYYHLKSGLDSKDLYFIEALSSGTPPTIANITENTYEILKSSSIIQLGISLAILFIVTLLIFIIVFELHSHLKILKEQIEDMSKGNMDLTRRINIVSFDDIGEMTSGMNDILINLKDTFSEIKTMIQSVYQSSKEMNHTLEKSHEHSKLMSGLIHQVDDNTQTQVETINQTADSISQMVPTIENSLSLMEEQSAAVEETSIGLKKLIDSINLVARSTGSLESVFENVLKFIGDGNEKIDQSISAMRNIDKTNDKVGEILSIISDIADNTNMLAMNAAVQAAHAGEKGRGFAVVAEEIRDLAENTARSTGDIESLIDEMNKKIANGLSVFESLKSILQTMFQSVNNTGLYISEITEETSNQSEQASHHADDVDRLLNMTGNLKTNAEEQRASNTSLLDSLTQLKDIAKGVVDVNQNLTEYLKSITDSLSKVYNNFENTYSSFKILDDKVSVFKIEEDKSFLTLNPD